MLPANVEFAIGHILVSYRKLFQAFVLQMAKAGSEILDAEVFDQYYCYMRGKYKLEEDYQQQALKDSMLPFYGKPLSVDLCRDLAWRLAGTKALLEQGKALAPALFVGANKVWVPLYIEDCELEAMAAYPRLKVEFRICAGKYAGHKFTYSMAHNQLVRVFAKSLGFPKWRRANYRELVQCGLLAALYCDQYGAVVVDEVAATKALVSHNTKIRSNRRRTCALNEKTACHNCFRGYEGYETCKHACRRHSLVKQHCWKCDREAWYKPNASVTAVCEHCRLRAANAKLVLENHG